MSIPDDKLQTTVDFTIKIKSENDDGKGNYDFSPGGLVNSQAAMLEMIKLMLNSHYSQIQCNLSPQCQNEPLDLSRNSSSFNLFSKNQSLPKRLWKPKYFDFDDFFATKVKRFTANDVCNARCIMLYKDHYHCFADNGCCTEVLKGKEQLRQHGKRHSIAEEVTKVEFNVCLRCDSMEIGCHYHCGFPDCKYISSNLSNMERLHHIESTHYEIVLKRTNCTAKSNMFNKKRKRESNDKTTKTQSQTVIDLSSRYSPVSIESPNNNPSPEINSESIMNQINTSLCYNILQQISSDKSKLNGENSRFYVGGGCSRLFCNLKKADHFHCPVCDVGCSKRDLYDRHLKRHK